jgi:hypothetical protein
MQTRRLVDKQEVGKKQKDPLYLFQCHIEWRDKKNLQAYQELISALDDADENVRELAEDLLHRASPRPRASECCFAHRKSC